MKKKINTKIRLGRYHNGEWFVDIQDESSGTFIMRGEFDSQGLADLLSSREITVKTDFFENPNIGKKHECQEVKIDLRKLPGIFENYDKKSQARDMKHIADYAEELYPGWTADREDHMNGHKRKGDYYMVILRRYV